MQLSGLWRLVLLVAVASVMAFPVSPASGQSAELDAETRAQLAAIPLTTDDLPNGYTLVREAFLTADQAAFSNIDQTQLTEAGFQGYYTSVYMMPGSTDTISTYASGWSDGDSAAAGFEMVEDESVTNPEGGLSDQDFDAGDGPAELTTGAVEVEGTTLELTDATFVLDRFIVGVTVRASEDNAIDQDGINALVDTLEDRASGVAGGDAPEGVDLDLASRILDLRPLGSEVQAGFLSAGESETLYGVSGSSLSGIESSWVSLVATGPDATGPYVVIAASKFENSDNAGRVVEQSADLVPLTVELQQVDDFGVDGVDAVRGYQYANPLSDGGEADSFRAVAHIGETVYVIDAQGATSADAARTAASNLMVAQVQCDGGSCELPEVDLGS